MPKNPKTNPAIEETGTTQEGMVAEGEFLGYIGLLGLSVPY